MLTMKWRLSAVAFLLIFFIQHTGHWLYFCLFLISSQLPPELPSSTWTHVKVYVNRMHMIHQLLECKASRLAVWRQIKGGWDNIGRSVEHVQEASSASRPPWCINYGGTELGSHVCTFGGFHGRVYFAPTFIWPRQVRLNTFLELLGIYTVEKTST